MTSWKQARIPPSRQTLGEEVAPTPPAGRVAGDVASTVMVLVLAFLEGQALTALVNRRGDVFG
jgi:hypothetical protein